LAWQQPRLAAPSRELRQAVASELKQAMGEARKGPVSAELLTKTQGDLAALKELLIGKVTELQPGPFAEAKQYLGDLNEAVKVLQRDDVARFAAGALGLDPARIKTVPDLVEVMAEKELTVAPPVRGDETAYL